MRQWIAPLLAAASFLPAQAAQPGATETIEVAEANQYFAALPGYFGADDDRGGTKRGITISGIYGYRWSAHWGLELNLTGSTIETGSQEGTDFYQQGGTVDLVYGFKDRSLSWTPFALLGVGAVQNDVIPDSEDEVSFIANAGLGVVSRPLTRLGFKLRAEGRYQIDQFQDGYQDYRLLAGIEFPFGRRTVTLAPIAPPLIEVREVVKEVIVPMPFVDTDKDSIEDSRDKCPDTPEGLKVDSDGCVIEGQILELRGVTFAFNKAELQLNAQTVLDYVTKGMKGQPTMTVEIAGHTDSLGSASYNLKLSQRRAEAVRNYLLAQGIEAARLTARGYGKSELLVNPERNEIDKERNRRVMFRVVGK
ncbi:MAG: OmpA family protein [Pseudomonadota bacterium]